MLGVEEAVEILRGIPSSCWLLVPVVFLSFSLGPDPAAALHEFTAHRMQQFDLQGVRYGSRSALVNMEAKGEGASMLSRKCVVVQWKDLSSEKFLDLVQRGAGSLLVILPLVDGAIEEETTTAWKMLEVELFKLEVPIPVYFAWEDEELLELYAILTTTAQREKDSSVASMMFATLGDYGYQMVTVGEMEAKPVEGLGITTIIGTLIGQGLEHKLPTVAVLAHYDAMGLAPSLSCGVDSNASGVAALLELARLFSRLYSEPNNRPKYNLVFVLSGGGKFNYFGTKGLLDDDLDGSPLLPSADYVLCLDSLLNPGSSDLYLHVSKPPKEGTKSFAIIQALNQSAGLVSPKVTLQLVHKKVRLSDDLLAWEHERFSVKRLPAATLSSLESHRKPRWSSMFASRSGMKVEPLARNVRVIAEGVARHIYGIADVDSEAGTSFLGASSYDVQPDSLELWLQFLSSQSRSPQLLDSKHPVVVALEHALDKYTHEVTTLVHQPDKNDREFTAYDIPSSKMVAYRVKPAIFDLFLAFGIAVYAFSWYLTVLLFSKIQTGIISSLPFPISIRAPQKIAKSD